MTLRRPSEYEGDGHAAEAAPVVKLDWTAAAIGASIVALRSTLESSRDEDTMSIPSLNVVTCLHAISARLTEATALSKAAMTCAEAGSEREALRIALDLDVLLREAITMHSALCLVGRMRV